MMSSIPDLDEKSMHPILTPDSTTDGREQSSPHLLHAVSESLSFIKKWPVLCLCGEISCQEIK
jgi:hypothetical protein